MSAKPTVEMMSTRVALRGVSSGHVRHTVNSSSYGDYVFGVIQSDLLQRLQRRFVRKRLAGMNVRPTSVDAHMADPAMGY
jgi:hypothetical protein